MKDFVSRHWISVVALVTSMSIVSAIVVRSGFPWTGLAWATLATSAAVFVAMRSTLSVSQVIRDVEAEPRLAVAVPERVARPVGRAQPGSRGKGTP